MLTNLRLQQFILAALVLAMGPASYAQPADLEDLAKGPVDPYNAGSERSRFLAAAGVDSEIDEAEYKANGEASDPFVRKFDSWGTLKRFDKNGNSKIDWFEADAYRRAIRKGIIKTFDQNKDQRLNAAERDAANKSLAAGKLAGLQFPGKAATPNATVRTPQGNTGNAAGGTSNNAWDKDGDGKMSREEREAWGKAMRERRDKERKETLEKFDANGNGELDGDERTKAYQARLDAWKERDPEGYERYQKRREEEQARREKALKDFDADGDGELNREEREKARNAAIEKWRKDNPEQAAAYDKRREEMKQRWADLTKKYDKDGSGELDGDERRAAFEEIRNQQRERYGKLVEKYDADGDGRLNGDEWGKAREAGEASGFGTPGRGRGGDGGRDGGRDSGRRPQQSRPGNDT